MEWLILLLQGAFIGLLLAFLVLLIIASNGSQPAWMSAREMRNRYGTPTRTDARRPCGGYQPQQSKDAGRINPPPKHR